jgi:hypothetical protein
MPDLVAPSPSARAKCRGCGRPIDKGELRFGEADANPFGEGETHRWFHLRCAALKRPERFGPMLEATPDVPDRETLEDYVKSSLDHPRLVRILRAERAPSGRAHCRHCREIVEKGALRVALEIWEDGRFNPMGSIHATCAPSYFGTREELAKRLEIASPELPKPDLAEMAEVIAKAPEVAAVAREPAPEGTPGDPPGREGEG